MTDFLTRLAARTLGQQPLVEPMIPTRHAAGPAFGSTEGSDAPTDVEVEVQAASRRSVPARARATLAAPDPRSAASPEPRTTLSPEPSPVPVPQPSAAPSPEPSAAPKPSARRVAAARPPHALRVPVRDAPVTSAASEASPETRVPRLAAAAPPVLDASEAPGALERWKVRPAAPARFQQVATTLSETARPAPDVELRRDATPETLERAVRSGPAVSVAPASPEDPPARGATGTVVRGSRRGADRAIQVVAQGLHGDPPPAVASSGFESPPSRAAAPHVSADARAHEAPVVAVSIGRIEVYAMQPPAPAPRPRAAAATSLEDYVRRRPGRRG